MNIVSYVIILCAGNKDVDCKVSIVIHCQRKVVFYL